MLPTPSELQAIRARIATCIQELPPLPAVVSRLISETQREDVSIQDLERYLMSDPALATKVLRVSNSAYYGMTRQISSLSQAVVVLGLQQLRNLMLSISATNLLKPNGPTQREMHQRFWFRSISLALSSQVLAKRCRLPVAEQELAYTAGLLQDIGVLFLWTNFSETYREIERRVRAGESRTQVEVEQLGLHHAQVGQVLSHFWRFPVRLEALVGSHENSSGAATDPLVPILQLADGMISILDSNKVPPDQLSPETLEAYGIEEGDWTKIVQEVLSKRGAYQQEFSPMAA